MQRSVRRLVLGVAILAILSGCVENVKGNDACHEENPPRVLNYLNFLRQNDYRIPDDVARLYEAAREEVRLAREYDLPATFLLQYDVLVDTAYQHLLKEQLPEGCEIGVWWEITKPHYEAAGLKWPFEQVWYPYDVMDFGVGHSPEVRERLVDVYMTKFKEVFGYLPQSVGSWYIDAYTLNYMVEKYGITASCVCKEQVGTDGYTLWGGYWGQAYYPSKLNAHMPAQTKEGQIDVPIFRMLGSDPIRQYDDGLKENGQGIITMECVNGVPGSQPEWVRYFMHSFAEEPCLAFSYVQVGQENSFCWSAFGTGLTMQMGIIDSLRHEGKLQAWTLGQSGRWFKEHYAVTPATAVTAMNDWSEEDLKTVWYDSRYYRVNMLWTKDGFRIRDIHKFDERKASPYLKEAAKGTKLLYYTLPLVDGFLWSRGQDIAGLRIRLADGSVAILDEPDIVEHADGVMTLTSRVKQGGGSFTFTLSEDCIAVKSKGCRGWLMELRAPVAERVPFTDISSDKVSAVFENFAYEVCLGRGSFMAGEGEHPFSIIPHKGEVLIQMGIK